MSKVWSEGEAVQKVAVALIPKYHSELADARLMYVFVSEASTDKNGRQVPGKSRRITGFLEWALDCDFVIEIAADVWKTLDADQRTALVDHYLERCTGEEDEETGEMTWKLREPDVSEFQTILERHGAWHDQLTGFVSVAQKIDISFLSTDSLQEADQETNGSSDLLQST
jgi:hypothetical protein